MSARQLVPLVLLLGCDQDFQVTAHKDEIDITPAVTDLGAKAVGSTTEFSLYAVSIAGNDVDIKAIDVLNVEGEYFDFTGELVTVPAGEESSAALEFTYIPLEIGYHRAEVTVISDALESEITVHVRAQAAEAYASVWPPVADFGPVEPPDVGSFELTLSNDGYVPIQLEQVGFDNSLFTLGSALPLEVDAGEQQPIELLFTPENIRAVEGFAQLSLDVTSIDLSEVTLRANDCENGDVMLYDEDGDGYATCGNDCDDSRSDVHPGATETWDGVDQDCDDIIDEGTEGYDDDGDGYAEVDGDCNDNDVTISPEAIEDYGNGIDDDCDGIVDSDMPDPAGVGSAEAGGDCDDYDASANPGESEQEDGIDNDCNGLVDDTTDVYDDDGDCYCESGTCVGSVNASCSQVLDGDCDDTTTATYPNASEAADWMDNDCDGTVDEMTSHSDDDGDGFTETGGDCDDTDPTVSPANLETQGDGIDNDCDGVAE